MRLAWFVRRRTLPVPTLAGWALLAALAAGGAALVGCALPRFLAVDAPVGRGLLIVEGWLPRPALDAAAATARAGAYGAVVVTGGPMPDPPWGGGFESYAERGAAYLRPRVGGLPVTAVPAPATPRERTWESARALRRWLDATGARVEAADVFTAGPHARRSRALFRRALGDGVEVGSRAVPPSDYELARWWRRSEGARDVLEETIGYGWMVCCFRPRDGG